MEKSQPFNISNQMKGYSLRGNLNPVVNGEQSSISVNPRAPDIVW